MNIQRLTYLNDKVVSHKLASFSLVCVFHCCWKLPLLKTHSGFPPENWWAEVVRPHAPRHTLKRETLHTAQVSPHSYKEIIERARHLSSQLCRASMKPASGHRAAGWARRQKLALTKSTKPDYLPASETLISRHISHCVSFKPPEKHGSSGLHAHHAGPTSQTEVWCSQSLFINVIW